MVGQMIISTMEKYKVDEDKCVCSRVLWGPTKNAIFEQTHEGGQRVRTLSGIRVSRQRDY